MLEFTPAAQGNNWVWYFCTQSCWIRSAGVNASRLYVFLKTSYLLTMFKEQSNPTLPTPAQCGHFVITDSFLCPWSESLYNFSKLNQLIRTTAAISCQEPITRSEQLPILGLYNGVFTVRFIFRHILGQFFPRKWNLRHIYERIWSVTYQKGKRNVIKRQKLSILGLYVLLTCFWDLKDIVNSRQNHSKNKLVHENAVTRVHGGCSLQVMGSCSCPINRYS